MKNYKFFVHGETCIEKLHSSSWYASSWGLAEDFHGISSAKSEDRLLLGDVFNRQFQEAEKYHVENGCLYRLFEYREDKRLLSKKPIFVDKKANYYKFEDNKCSDSGYYSSTKSYFLKKIPGDLDYYVIREIDDYSTRKTKMMFVNSKDVSVAWNQEACHLAISVEGSISLVPYDILSVVFGYNPSEILKIGDMYALKKDILPLYKSSTFVLPETMNRITEIDGEKVEITVISLSKQPPSLQKTNRLSSDDTLLVPPGCYRAYADAENWSKFKKIQELSVKEYIQYCIRTYKNGECAESGMLENASQYDVSKESLQQEINNYKEELKQREAEETKFIKERINRCNSNFDLCFKEKWEKTRKELLINRFRILVESKVSDDFSIDETTIKDQMKALESLYSDIKSKDIISECIKEKKNVALSKFVKQIETDVANLLRNDVFNDDELNKIYEKGSKYNLERKDIDSVVSRLKEIDSKRRKEEAVEKIKIFIKSAVSSVDATISEADKTKVQTMSDAQGWDYNSFLESVIKEKKVQAISELKVFIKKSISKETLTIGDSNKQKITDLSKKLDWNATKFTEEVISEMRNQLISEVKDFIKKSVSKVNAKIDDSDRSKAVAMSKNLKWDVNSFIDNTIKEYRVTATNALIDEINKAFANGSISKADKSRFVSRGLELNFPAADLINKKNKENRNIKIKKLLGNFRSFLMYFFYFASAIVILFISYKICSFCLAYF